MSCVCTFACFTIDFNITVLWHQKNDDFLEDICIVNFVTDTRVLYQLILLVALTFKAGVLELKKVLLITTDYCKGICFVKGNRKNK